MTPGSRQFVIGQLGDVLGDRFLRKLEPPGAEPAAPQRSYFGHLSQLAHNPFLLQAMLTVHSAAPSGELAHHRGALLRQLVSVLWERDTTRQTPGWIPEEGMTAAFARLAFAMIDGDLPQEIPATLAPGSSGGCALAPGRARRATFGCPLRSRALPPSATPGIFRRAWPGSGGVADAPALPGMGRARATASPANGMR